MIKILMIGGAAAVLLASSSAAYAEQTNGIVSSVNPGSGTLTLQSGETFQFSQPQRLYGILPGYRVGVSHDGSRGINAYDPHPATRDNIDID